MEGRDGFAPFAMTEWRMEHTLIGAGPKSLSNRSALSVMVGLVPAIYAVERATKRDCSGAALKTTMVAVLKPHMTLRRVDGRDKPGYDGGRLG